MKSFSQRLLITVLSLWTGLTALHAANVVTVTGSDGAPDGETTITVALKTDAADVAAAEIRIPLPEGIEPVEGSVSLDSGRAPGHSVTADMNGSDYVIVIFNTSLATIPAGDGRLLTFKVKLGDNPGRFDLTPRVKLSGKGGDALASGGSLNILAPRLELGTTAIDFGRVPIRSEAVQYVSVRNSGTTTLTFGGYDTGVEGLTAIIPQQLGEGEWGTIELHYSPTVRSAGIDGRLTPESDGVGRRQFIRILSVPFSVNELHIGNASGISDEEVTVSVSMNNMEPITGADFSIALPDELDFVDGSVSKGARASALSVESTVGADRRLRIVLFGLSNKAVEGNDGELLSFRLKLKGRSGYYTLTPEKTRLANAAGEDMTSEVYSGSVTIDSPQLSSDSDWQIGNVALSGTHSFGYNVYNSSSVPLTIEKVVFPDDIAECETAMPLVVAPYGQSEITVRMKKPEFGKFATTMNLYTNDPDNRMKSVSITGNFYSPNEMSFAGRSAGGKFLIDATLSNEEPIAALQLDIVCPDGISTDESLLELAARASGHSATLAKVDRYRYRLVIFSLKNTPFTGNDGLLFSLGIEGASAAGKQVCFENIKLSSTDGVNITTPDSDVKLGELPIPVSSITLSEQALSLRVGQTVTLTATVLPYDATDKTVTWTSSNEAVATVDADGKVTAKALGQAVITAKCGEVSATCAVTVIPTPAESVTLSQTTASLRVGQTVTLTATVMPEDATDKTVTWTSSNEAVANVDAEGKVTAMALGEAVITAKCGDVSATCAVTVVATPVESVTLSQTTASLRVGQTVTLTATVQPEDATDKTVTWSSSNEAVATVDAEGKVTAMALGEAVITASCGDASATCAVTVVATPVESVTLNQTTASLRVGQTVTLTATVQPEDATDKTVTWSSSNEAVATVDAEGKVTAMALGEAVITATCGDVSATCAVTVVPTPAESVTLNQITASLRVGQTVTLTATVMPEDATDKTVTWTSSNEAIATVDAEGKVTAMALGEAAITATCGDVSATCAVTVVATSVESVTLDYESIELRLGETFVLTATVMPDDATDKTVTWTSSDTGVITVDENGQITAVGMKDSGATVTATAVNGVSASCHVTVLAPLATSIELDQTMISATVGDEVQLTATILPAEASNQAIEWRSSDETIATVSASGLVSVVAVGDVTITASTTDGSNLSATCVIKAVSGVEFVYPDDTAKHDVYNLQGIIVKRDATIKDFKALRPGFYIVNGKKVYKR